MGSGSIRNGGLGLQARRFLHGAVVSFIEDIKVPLFAPPCGGVRNAERFLARCFGRFHPNLDECLDFHLVASSVGAPGRAGKQDFWISQLGVS